MSNQISFYSNLIDIDEDLSRLTSRPEVTVTVERDKFDEIPQKLFRCPVCRCRFIYFPSFVQSCGSHLSEVVRFDEVPVKVEPEVSESGDESSSMFSASNDESDEDEKVPKRQKKRKNVSVLPTDHVFLCKLCDKTFIRRQTYRDHLLGHENPLIKCCKICATQFSSGIIASKHKKKFHPELYQEEMRERAAARAKHGRSRTVYHTIHKSLVTSDSVSGLKTRTKPQIRGVTVVLDRIYLPGFLPYDWIYLPKKKEDYPWVVEKIQVEPNPKDILKQVKKEEESEDDFHNWTNDNDFDESLDIKSESPKQQETIKTTFEEKPVTKKDTSARNSSFYIKPEEISHIPEFLGAKYIFNVYDERRNKKLKEIKKRKKQSKKRRRSSEESSCTEASDTEETPVKDRPKKHYASYKPDPKTCLICGETRTKSNIRRHIATHCIEEDDRECRICTTTHMAANKLREHYSRVHNIKFREYLYKMQKEKMEKGDATPVDYVTCSICYTNMRNEDHLKYHYEMLHNYKPGGGKTKATDLDCHICGKTFKEAQTRNLHIRRIHKQMFDGQIFCHYCGKDFMGKGYLLSHFRYAHFDENGEFKESLMKKTKYEYNKKQDKQLFVCEMCGEVKETKGTMMKHRHEKHGVLDPEYKAMIEKDYEENDCPHCSKHFTSIRKFKDHEKYHLKEQSDLFCQVCGIKCKTDIFLKAHMQRHGEKKFFCEFEGCRKGFAVKYDYLTHKKRAHGSGESFPCKRCDQVFRTWKLRRNHEESEHGIVKVKLQRNKRLMPNAGYKDDEGGDCRFCGKHFDNYRKWQNHEYHHKKIIPDLHCEICGAKSTTEYNLKRHMERHGEIQYFCDYPGCGKGFTVKHDVRIHARRAHKDLFQTSSQTQPTISVSSSPVYSESGSQHQVFQVYSVMPPPTAN